MRILHISDLHYDPTADFEQARVLRALRADLHAFQEDRPIDAVVFTGDLVYAGTSSSVFHEAIVEYIWPILDEDLSLSLDQLVLVPGNHDIDRDEVDVTREASLEEYLSSESLVSGFIDDPVNESTKSARLANFFVFVKDTWPDRLSSASELGYVANVDTASGPLRVLCANSAWRATGQPNDVDRHSLLVGQRQLDQLLRNSGDDVPTVFACHHAPDWLADFDARVVERELTRSSHVALFGHTHHARPVLRSDEYGEIAMSNAGALFAGEGHRNTYAIIDLDDVVRNVKMHFRVYTGRDVFAPDTEISDDGTWERPLRAVEQRKSTTVTTDKPTDSLRAQLNLGLKLLQQPVKPGSEPLQLLIPPPVADSRAAAGAQPRQRHRADERETLSVLSRCLQEETSLLLFGERERGKTSALNWLLVQSIERNGRFVVFLDFSELTVSRDSLLRLIRRKLMAAGVRTEADLSGAPRIAVALDNFDPLRGKVSSNALTFIAAHPEIVFFLSVYDDGVSPVPDVFPASFQENIGFLSNFGVREIRGLVQQLYPDDQDHWDAIVESAIQILMNQGLSRTPWTIVMILLIFQYEPALKRADVTLLVDKYLDLLLGKWQTDSDLDVMGIDYINRKYFLTLLAVELNDRVNRSMSELELTQYVTGYLNDRGLYVSSHRFIQDLYDRRVLGGSPSSITFTLGDVFEFFLASAVQLRALDSADLLQDKVRYFDAIVHLMAMSRDRREILEALSLALTEIGSALPSAETTLLFNSIDPEAWGDAPELEESREALRKIGTAAQEAQTEAARDELADKMLESRDERTPDDEEAETISIENREIIHGFQRFHLHLYLLSLCLDRSEHVPDQGFKVQLLTQCVLSYSKLFIAMKAMARIYEEEVSTELAHLRAQSQLTSKRIDALLEMGAFWHTSAMAIGALADQKLRRAISEVVDGDSIDEGDMPARLIAVLLAIFSEAPSWRSGVDSALAVYGERPHVHRLVYRALAVKFYDRDISQEYAAELAEALADLSTGKVDGRMRRQAHQGMIDELQQARQLILRQPLIDSFEGSGRAELIRGSDYGTDA